MSSSVDASHADRANPCELEINATLMGKRAKSGLSTVGAIDEAS